MDIKNFLHSGFTFRGAEELLKFKFKVLNAISVIIIIFSTLFGLMSDLGINDLGAIHSKVNYVYAFMIAMTMLYLRRSRGNYTVAANALLLFSFLTFISALVHVPQDEFRMIWFYLLVYVAYILLGTRVGLLYTVLSVFIILYLSCYIDLQLSQIAINSGVLGLIIGSLLSKIYTNKISEFEDELQEKNRYLHLLASTDGLTGITNKRKFDELTLEYFDQAKRSEVKLSIMIVDIDYFKEINDKYGHIVGDRVLKFFVETTRSLLRKSDVFGRIGGDEFSILLFDTDEWEARQVGEKICQEVHNKSLSYKECERSFTVSIGCSESKHSDESYKDLLERADQALYKAKSKGRNRVDVI